MAQQDDIIIKVDVDVAEYEKKLSLAIAEIQDLKTAQAELNKQYKDGTITAEEYGKATADNKQRITELSKTIRTNTSLVAAAQIEDVKASATLDEKRAALNALQKAYGQLKDEQKNAEIGGKTLTDRIKELSDVVKEEESAIGDDRRKVGSYTESILKAGDAFHDLADATKVSSVAQTGLGKATDSLDKAMKLAAKNPWMAVLSLILPLLQQLFKALRGNEEAMEQVRKIMDAMSQAFKQFEPIISKVAGLLTNVLGKAFDFITAAITNVLKGIDWLAKKLGFDLNLSGVFSDAANAANDLADAEEDAAERGVDAERKKVDELGKLREQMERRRRTDLENEIADLEAQKEKELSIKGLTTEEKLEIEDYYNDQIAKKRKAAEDAAKADEEKAAEEERKRKEKEDADAAKQAEAELKRQADLLKRLEDENKTEQQKRYDSDLAFLNELHDAKLISEEEYLQRLQELNKQYMQDEQMARAENAVQTAQLVLSSLSQMNDAFNQIEEAELQGFKDGQEQRKKALEKRLQAGEISQAEYAKQTEAIDEEVERKEKETAREQAKRDKALGIFNAVISTAGAIIGFLANPGFPLGIPLSVMAGITGAAQIAAIAAQPLPAFEHGGTIDGTSYTGDNVLIRANSGEGVTTGKQANNLLQEIANNPARGGFDYELMAEAMSAQPAPVVVYTEMEQFGQKVATYDEIARV